MGTMAGCCESTSSPSERLLETQLKRNAAGKLKGTRRQLARDSDGRLTEAHARRRSIPIRPAVTDKVGMVEDIERFSAKMQDDSFVVKRERALEKRRHFVNRPASARVPRHDRRIDDGTIGCRSDISAVSRTSNDVVGQARPEGRDSAEVDLQRESVGATYNEALALVKDSAPILDTACEIRVIRILARNIRVNVVDRVRPGVAGEH